jgi:hypothetical protein
MEQLNKSDGTFIQLEDLKAVGAVPTDFKSGPGEKPKKYPDKKVYCLFRIKNLMVVNGLLVDKSG